MYAAPPPLPPPSRGIREHDGFYLRLGVGLGRLGASFNSGQSSDFGGSVDGGIVGASLASEIAIGGTPAPGLVLGGGIWLDQTGSHQTHDLKVNGASMPNVGFDSLTLGLIGPFADFYVNPRSGFHVQGALGIAWVTVGGGDKGPHDYDQVLGGLGFMVGGGYEWWIAEQWSLGGVVRMLYGSVQSDRQSGDQWSYKAFAIPEVAFVATYH
jgi:hypothetical protein